MSGKLRESGAGKNTCSPFFLISCIQECSCGKAQFMATAANTWINNRGVDGIDKNGIVLKNDKIVPTFDNRV